MHPHLIQRGLTCMVLSLIFIRYSYVKFSGVGTYPALYLPYKLAGGSQLLEVPLNDTLSAALGFIN